MQLRDFSMENPGAEYGDVVEFFGNPEDVYVNYIQSRGREEIYLKFQKRGTVKLVLRITVLAIILIWITIFYYWQKSYTVFYQELPKSKESVLNEGDDYK